MIELSSSDKRFLDPELGLAMTVMRYGMTNDVRVLSVVKGLLVAGQGITMDDLMRANYVGVTMLKNNAAVLNVAILDNLPGDKVVSVPVVLTARNPAEAAQVLNATGTPEEVSYKSDACLVAKKGMRRVGGPPASARLHVVSSVEVANVRHGMKRNGGASRPRLQTRTTCGSGRLCS
jgi:hypothetical protein